MADGGTMVGTGHVDPAEVRRCLAGSAADS